MKFFLCSLPLFFCSWLVVAFPQNSRLNYPSCISCHVSPSGGGILTKYGRALSEELSTWSYEGEGQFAHGLGSPDNLLIGGDIRWLNVTRKSPILDYSKLFYMQVESELALKPIPGLAFVATIGKYNEGDKYEYRRNYALLDVGDYFHFRLGRFMPSYGLNLPDHTTSVHPGQGSETYNFEVSHISAFGELFITLTHGPSRSIRGSDEGYKLNKGEEGYVIRMAGYLFGSSIIGASVGRLSGIDKYGPYAILGFNDLYLLLQYDYHSISDAYFTEVGYEAYRGASLFARFHGKEGSEPRYASGVQLLPRPHVEIQGLYEYQLIENTDNHTYIFMLHYWL